MGERETIWDVVVVGAGIAGAATALGLKQAMGGTGRVMLCDPALAGGLADVGRGSLRALALAPDVRHHLEALGVWPKLEGRAQPVSAMVITDARPGLLPNPAFLSFDQTMDRQAPLAYLVLAGELRHVLLAACAEAEVAFGSGSAVAMREERWAATLSLADGRQHRARLVAAADGGQSRLRHAARIQVLEVPYGQSAIVATLHHEQDHGGRAVQHFFPAGPIALLPLKDQHGGERWTSLVWTESHDEAERLAALPAAAFCAALEDRIGLALGSLKLEDRPQAHRLTLRLAKQLAAPRLALLGDAARAIHPLAGQGLNLGLRDAETLTRHVHEAVGLGLDPGAASVLEAYQRERRPDAALMAAGTDLLARLFSNDAPVLRAARDLGLGTVDRLSPLKRRFARLAGGPDQPAGGASDSASAAAP